MSLAATVWTRLITAVAVILLLSLVLTLAVALVLLASSLLLLTVLAALLLLVALTAATLALILSSLVVVVLLLTSATSTLSLTLSLSLALTRSRTGLTLTALAATLLLAALLALLLTLVLLTTAALLLLLAATLAGLADRLRLPVLVVLQLLHEGLEVVDRGLLRLELGRGHLLNVLQRDPIGRQVLVARDQLVLVNLAIRRDVDCLVQSALAVELELGDVVVEQVIVLMEQDRRHVLERLAVDEVVTELGLLVEQPERVYEEVEARR